MGFIGQPYFITFFNDQYYITEISADRGNGIRCFSAASQGEITDIDPLYFWEEVTDESRKIYEARETIKQTSSGVLADLIIFAGQSNMAGKGENEKAPVAEKGYEFRAVSDPSRLYTAIEPFGVDENRDAGINHTWDGITLKTGGLVTSFMNAYTSVTNVPVIGISASEGNTRIEQWLPGTARYTDMISRLHDAKEYLDNHEQFTIRHCYLVWCQGESDGDIGTTGQQYKQKLRE